MDISKRYSNGEFTEKDSIHFADSLKFETPKGKVVYGGGGIMPDYFVSVDTLGYSETFRKIVAKGLIYRFAFKYSDSHRSELLKYKDYEKLNAYLKSQKIFSQLINFVKKEGVSVKDLDLKVSKSRIENYVMAYINRNILDDEGFYPTILLQDLTVLKALETIHN
jgi:carboxyl-terminal processing protease